MFKQENAAGFLPFPSSSPPAAFSPPSMIPYLNKLRIFSSTLVLSGYSSSSADTLLTRMAGVVMTNCTLSTSVLHGSVKEVS